MDVGTPSPASASTSAPAPAPVSAAASATLLWIPSATTLGDVASSTPLLSTAAASLFKPPTAPSRRTASTPLHSSTASSISLDPVLAASMSRSAERLARPRAVRVKLAGGMRAQVEAAAPLLKLGRSRGSPKIPNSLEPLPATLVQVGMIGAKEKRKRPTQASAKGRGGEAGDLREEFDDASTLQLDVVNLVPASVIARGFNLMRYALSHANLVLAGPMRPARRKKPG
ncbi:unnamed protein product [Peniophora sp. CBMAI 1063]|nr:unnamed protein product [Peniophora sp. CBMAI 1063]